jgi:hypothetical protein
VYVTKTFLSLATCFGIPDHRQGYQSNKNIFVASELCKLLMAFLDSIGVRGENVLQNSENKLIA